jgi:hypothetical protein
MPGGIAPTPFPTSQNLHQSGPLEQEAAMERLDYRLLEDETETVLGFARHGPGFR